MSHIMLQSDTLANEFNEILNGVEIFAPFQPLDPAVTFYAPLRNNVRDLRLSQDNFQRASDAWYKDGSGVYRNVGNNQARFEEARLLMEPAGTNICENYNARPDPTLTNVTLGGSGVLERVNDAAALAAAGLADIGNGHAIRVLSQGATANANIAGPAATSYSSISAWIKKIGTTGIVQLRTSGGTLVQTITNQEYERISLAGPVNDNELLQVRCTTNAEAFFVLNQFEVSPVVTSPIVTEGTAGQRAVEELSWNPDPVESAEGMVILNWTPRFDNVDHPSGLQTFSGILSLRNNSNASLCRYVRNTSNAAFFQVTDGANVQNLGIDDPSKNITFTFALQWQGSEYHQGYKRSDTNLWTWREVRSPYDGSWITDGGIWLSRPEFYAQSIGEIYVYNEYRDEQWIEDNH